MTQTSTAPKLLGLLLTTTVLASMGVHMVPAERRLQRISPAQTAAAQSAISVIVVPSGIVGFATMLQQTTVAGAVTLCADETQGHMRGQVRRQRRAKLLLLTLLCSILD